MQDLTDDQDISNLEETQDSNLETEPTNDEPNEVIEENNDAIKSELEKTKQLAQNYKVRAEKAEQLAKQLKNKMPTGKSSDIDINLKNVRALQDVPDEDIDEIIEFAKYKKISIAEAKKSPVMQVLLKTRAEERTTAAATNTATSRRSSSKQSPEVLLNKLSAGELKDDEMQAAIKARIEQQRKNT